MILLAESIYIVAYNGLPINWIESNHRLFRALLVFCSLHGAILPETTQAQLSHPQKTKVTSHGRQVAIRDAAGVFLDHPSEYPKSTNSLSEFPVLNTKS